MQLLQGINHVLLTQCCCSGYQAGAVDPVLLLQGINRVLLENLLPAHVATHFLSILKGRPSEELYSQKVNGSLTVQRQEMLYLHSSFLSLNPMKKFVQDKYMHCIQSRVDFDRKK